MELATSMGLPDYRGSAGCLSPKISSTVARSMLITHYVSFIIEGIITLLSAIPVIFCLPDYPARAKWLNSEDKRFAEERLQKGGGGYNRDHASRRERIETLVNPRMLAHYFAYVGHPTYRLQDTRLIYLPTGSRRCSSRLLHLFHAHNRQRTWIHLDPSPTHDCAALVHWICCSHHFVLFRRPFQRSWLAHYCGIYRWWNRLADGWTASGRCICPTLWLSMSSSVWSISCGSVYDELGDLQHTESTDHPIRHRIEQLMRRNRSDHRPVDLEEQ